MPQQKEVVEGKLNGEGSMDTQAILITANTNSSHMLSRLPEQIRLASAITPHRSQFIGKNEKKKPCTGFARAEPGLVLLSDCHQLTAARRMGTPLLLVLDAVAVHLLLPRD